MACRSAPLQHGNVTMITAAQAIAILLLASAGWIGPLKPSSSAAVPGPKRGDAVPASCSTPKIIFRSHLPTPPTAAAEPSQNACILVLHQSRTVRSIRQVKLSARCASRPAGRDAAAGGIASNTRYRSLNRIFSFPFSLCSRVTLPRAGPATRAARSAAPGSQNAPCNHSPPAAPDADTGSPTAPPRTAPADAHRHSTPPSP